MVYSGQGRGGIGGIAGIGSVYSTSASSIRVELVQQRDRIGITVSLVQRFNAEGGRARQQGDRRTGSTGSAASPKRARLRGSGNFLDLAPELSPQILSHTCLFPGGILVGGAADGREKQLLRAARRIICRSVLTAHLHIARDPDGAPSAHSHDHGEGRGPFSLAAVPEICAKTGPCWRSRSAETPRKEGSGTGLADLGSGAGISDLFGFVVVTSGHANISVNRSRRASLKTMASDCPDVSQY
ncbi:hypothetical protein BT67DRAFT_488028 [Trichocladium antarcticum]|uniref:Uncharacterized protein n=1 Tax=Trichocladium antarcticum TaxID=1450529 RepID=A0AAN6UP09_9PEZI|nr:hypothetical protein BT67DRAFT_488028 [Trichocladium antarcticum]